jgi:hypothetical protein
MIGGRNGGLTAAVLRAETVGLISISIFGLRPSLLHIHLSALIGGVATRSVRSGPLPSCL